MTSESPEELLSQWSRLLLGALARAGVSDLVISPGSRSTPFVWAALHTTELRCFSVWDERAAGFFALGRAKVTNRPVALLCTSGSAAANYFPAVVEASLARVPLVVLTADRPLELQDTSAAQTIDQTKLYGDYARRFYELGTPDPSDSALCGLVRLAQQAVAASVYPEPGPVHLNARARKPLEPSLNALSGSELSNKVSALLARAPISVSLPESTPAAAAVEELARACRRAERGVIVCGPDLSEPEALGRLSRRTGFPLLCEATSQLRFAPPSEHAGLIDAFDWLFRCGDVRRELAPDVVLRFGTPPTSTGLDQLFAAASEYHVIARHGFPDPHSRAKSITWGTSAAVASALARLLEGSRPAPAQEAYAGRLRNANAAAWSAVAGLLDRSSGFCEGAAVRAALAGLPDGALLALGNSLPVREVDQYVPAAARQLRVLSQRGTNGIDGVLSAAVGAASAFAGPAMLLIGDVSFMHDLNGLDLARRLEQPLAIVLIDNGGGRIFEQLPMAGHFQGQPELARYWLTPQNYDFQHAAALFGLRYELSRTPEQLTLAARQALAKRGATIVHASVEAESARRDLMAGLELVAAAVREAQ